ncbi:PEPxxWA-CTERM sorting domain-containing protein [Gimibacter soli]|uniref:PEPxxWA-CTERM sorting domain-containing protein n=1 Tax=Gimibacter soli TaxID=3024400 RepID=A0AAF0BMC5_9PROT|nr:PEPxxWA-CTERM sorting domain-containing protein [Gimibacter soli]WCL55352.1 PEPxxWA-CTERM sorting domain-containing protein [Gimibacter soli]
MFFDRKTLAVAACLLTGTHTASAATEFHFSGNISSSYADTIAYLNGTDTFSAVLTIDTDAAGSTYESAGTGGTLVTQTHTYQQLEIFVGGDSWTFTSGGGLYLQDGISDGTRRYCTVSCRTVLNNQFDQIRVFGAVSDGEEGGVGVSSLSFYTLGGGYSSPISGLTFETDHLLMTDVATLGLDWLSEFNAIATAGTAEGGYGSINFTGLHYGYANLRNILLTDVVDLSLVGGIPEPATWLMMIMGFGLAGMASRRRQLRLA